MFFLTSSPGCHRTRVMALVCSDCISSSIDLVTLAFELLYLCLLEMGQFLSTILSLRTVPPLLKLPTEILLLVASQLSSSPESLVTLSLTCKNLSSILDRDAVDLCEASKRRLLLLLERDFGDAFFYCSFCCRLHHFSQQWHPKVLGAFRPSQRCFLYHENKMFHPTPDSYQFVLYASHHLTCLNIIRLILQQILHLRTPRHESSLLRLSKGTPSGTPSMFRHGV